MGGLRGTYWRAENFTRVSVGRPDGKRLRRRWESNIKMDLREVGLTGLI
jgi:hypothetical protein